MSEQPPQKRSLSEISHLFLSSVRDRQTNGAPRPQRTPPGAAQPTPPASQPGQAAPNTNMSIDLTPEEFAQVFGERDPAALEQSAPAARPAQVTAVIGTHLNGKQFDRVKEYARHLAAQGARIGLIELDASEFRLMCFEPSGASESYGSPAEPRGAECFDPRQMAEAIEEMNWDIDRWLLLVPSPRIPEAKALLRQVGHWTLLSTCDHDGVVSSYRSLKGLSEGHRPRLTLALLDAHDEAEMVRVFRKLSGVCQQFLDWTLEPEPAVRKSSRVSEHLVLFYRPTRDKALIAAAPQWEIVEEFLSRAKEGVVAQRSEGAAIEEPVERAQPIEQAEPVQRTMVGELVIQPSQPEPAEATDCEVGQEPKAAVETLVEPASTPAMAASESKPELKMSLASDSTPRAAIDEVLDLPNGAATADAVVGAVLRQAAGEIVECPVRAPMCGDARIAIARDGSIVLLAVARQGLGDLRSIGKAYRWLIENRPLLAMAVPQFAIDPHLLPRLRLFVDQIDLTAEVLQPMLQAQTVRVQAYRTLRWGEKTGLLLEAA